MCWSFVRGKIQIAMVVGRVCRVVVGDGRFIQRRHSVNEGTVVKSGWSFMRVVFHEEFHCNTVFEIRTIYLCYIDM